MLRHITMSSKEQVLIIYIFLAAITLAVFWQVNQFDFVSLDDQVYVTENFYIQSRFTLENIGWAFSTTYAEFWHPLTWLSLMLDYQLFGLNAGGYHMTNIILHILSTLLLFWLFNRMTGAVWKSTFVVAFFAIHPLRVESVAWVAERKDVLSVFFWMLTLCLYVYYTEKPVIKRYLLVCLSFACGLMSKSTVVTLPFIMILLDYWPLNRFEFQKGNTILRQLKEKLLFFVLSTVFIIITLYAQPPAKSVAVMARIDNALTSLITYLGKTLWPYNLTVFYPFTAQIPLWQVLGALFLIIIISFVVIIMVKRHPYFLVGWLWYVITIAPVIGIVKVGNHAMADRYTYLPSIGISIMIGWGIPLLFANKKIQMKILFPSVIVLFSIMTALTWQQCSYWKNNFTLFSYVLMINKNNYLAHNIIAYSLANQGKDKEAIDQYNQSIHLEPNYLPTYIKRGSIYAKLGQYQQAIEDYNEVIRRNPGNAEAYNNRGVIYAKFGKDQQAMNDYGKAISLNKNNSDTYINRGFMYAKLGQYQHALEDYSKAIHLSPHNTDAYIRIGVIYGELGQYQKSIENFNEAIRRKPDHVEGYNNRGFTYSQIGQYQQAINDYDKAISIKPDYTDAYMNRGVAYLQRGNNKLGCNDARKACSLGNCKTLESAQGIGLCR